MKFLRIRRYPGKGVTDELLEVTVIRRICGGMPVEGIEAVAVDADIAENINVKKRLADTGGVRVVYVSDRIDRLRNRMPDIMRSYGDNPYIDTIEKYIDLNFRDDISLKDLSELTFLSESYVSSLFKEKTGISIKDYIEERRLEYSRDLLLNTGLKVREIGKRCGFRSDSYFCRCFRERYGHPPQRYRALTAGHNLKGGN